MQSFDYLATRPGFAVVLKFDVDCSQNCVPDATRLDCVVTDADPGIPSQSAQTDCAGLCISHDPINRLVILCSFAIQVQSSSIVLIEAIIGSIGWVAKSEARFWVDCRIANGLR